MPKMKYETKNNFDAFFKVVEKSLPRLNLFENSNIVTYYSLK